MALETVNFTVDETAYVLIGDNVTGLTVTEWKVGNLRVHAVATGGAAPAVGAPYQEWDNEYSYTGSAADIYVLSPLGSTIVGVVRE